MSFNLKKIINYWRELSDYDLITAEFLFKAKRYPYCLFMCHLSIEKLLKALIIKFTKKHAPYSHNLVDLAKKTGIQFSKEDKILLSDLTEFNLEARYPEWQKEFYSRCSKNYTEDYLRKTQKLQKWLKKYL
ncbi:MAG: HEPN domain-containing protein [Patescibacteria group bacterium]|nr:HEPN domain-containing protein [Patescibacteria group bacterium]